MKKVIISVFVISMIALNIIIKMQDNNASHFNLTQIFKMVTANAEDPWSSGDCYTYASHVQEHYYPCNSSGDLKYYTSASYTCFGIGSGTCMDGHFETWIYCDGGVVDRDNLNTNASCSF